MHRFMKRISVFALVCVLVSAMACPAFAATTEDQEGLTGPTDLFVDICDELFSEDSEYTDAEATNNAEELASNNTESTPQEETPTTPEQQIAMLTEALEKEKKEYLFLMAEFDNFRKRTIKEKSEIIKNAKGQVLEEILPIVDDFERGLKAASDTENAQAIKEGMDLIYNKFISYLERNGIKAIESDGVEFNEDFHEAITTIPAPNESMKKKVIDTIQKGYMINDKVLRYAKVVVGQ